jgi:hypothetical protein
MAGALIVLAATSTSTLAAGPQASDTPLESCFGIAAAQRASTDEFVDGVDENGLGTHSSSFGEPRVGLGNLVFRIFGFESVGAAGSALAAIDEIDATGCP